MEPTVRNPRIEPAIASEVARRSHLSRRFPSAGQTVPSRNSVAGNGIFGCRDWRPKIHPRDRYCRRRPETLKIGNKIPAETASFRSTTVSAVREDWMVAEAVRRNRSLWQRKSDIREKYREDEELGPKKSLRRQENPASTRVFRPVPLQRLTGPDFGITGKLTANNRERV